VSAPAAGRAARGACASCTRRSWLLAELSPTLDHLAGEAECLNAALGLSDAELIDALGGRRRESLRARHAAFAVEQTGALGAGEAVCRHGAHFPPALCDPVSPWMLTVDGGAARLARLTSSPVVALLGSTRASDYGREIARSLARGLAGSGVTVASGLTDGIAAAAHAGAREARCASVAVLGGGLDVSCPARWRALYGRLTGNGCAVSELPRDCPGRRWGGVAAGRIVVQLADLVVVVEAREIPRELAAAHTARALGRPLAVLPGRVTSPLSSGPHALLIEGASPIRGVEDLLELLYRGARSPARCGELPGSSDHGRGRNVSVDLEPHLRAILDLVGTGADTPDRLAAAGAEPSGLLFALSELELRGLLARGENGRYLPRQAPVGYSAGDV
jgi:DNA processing protein